LYAPPPVTDVKSAKNDFFLDVVGKILDKLIAAIPVVIQKLFSFSLDELSRYDYQDYDVQTLYKNLGIFAYLPVVLLRLVKGISSFMSILKKNSFFKNFLMPALIPWNRRGFRHIFDLVVATRRPCPSVLWWRRLRPELRRFTKLRRSTAVPSQ
jgi:hypothetical protein